MKKLKFLLLLIIPLLLCGCGDKKYGLVELSCIELSNYLNSEGAVNITFAVAFSDSDDYDNFIEDLNKTANRAKEYIYYVDYVHVDLMSTLVFENVLSDYKNSYFVIQNNNYIVNSIYSDFQTMFGELNGKKYYPNIEYNSQDDVEKYFNEAKENYDKGLISSSNSYINAVWNNKEVKDYYNSNNYYNIIGSWVNYSIIDDDYYNYINIQVSSLFNMITVYEGKVDMSNFEKPTESKSYFYYIKDDDIYVSEEEDGKYKKKYHINGLEKGHLYLDVNGSNLGFYAE